MSSLVKIRSERDQMSAIERRIADFLLENAHLLRDYSSQQLADALGISQSSVVKFSQKLGFKGYPDLKFSIGEAVARENGNGRSGAASARAEDPHSALAGDLWRSKARAEEETRLINPPDAIRTIAKLLDGAQRVFCIGLGADSVPAQAFATKLAMLGIPVVHHVDAMLLAPSISTAAKGDVLLVFSEEGKQAALLQISRQFRERRGKVVSITRHTANSLRAHADASLLVSAHDERAHVVPLLYSSALQHLLDLIFVTLCEDGEGRLKRLVESLKRIEQVMEP
jgi:DNA-binding MurR/RpiR family transcriptional regulator